MTSMRFHPSEFAYAFSFSRTEDLIGWGSAPFASPDGTEAEDWLSLGAEKMMETGRLTGGPDIGVNIADPITSVILALINPAIVLSSERKDGDGLRRMTVHVSGDDFIGLTRRADGMFDLVQYANLTSACAACAAFIGAGLASFEDDARIDTPHAFLAKLFEYANAGKVKAAAKALMSLGVSVPNAASAVKALVEPNAKGLLSVYYCAANVVQDGEPFSVMTNTDDETWVLFPPASLEAPMTLERSSVSALAARISVGAVARMGVPA